MRLSEYRKRIEMVMLLKVPRLNSKGDPKPWLYIDSRTHNGALELVFRVPPGYSYLDLEKQVDALYATCGAAVELKEYAGAVLVRIFPEDFPLSIPYSSEYLKELKDKRDILIGFNRQGEPLIHSLRVPHLLIAGKSGYGKTDLVRWILFMLINQFTPDEVEIWIVDLKGFSFLPFKKIPHITRIARDLGGAKKLLKDAVKIMRERSKEIWDSGDRNKAKSYKLLFILIDEAYMISPNVIKDKEEKKIAQSCDESAAKISGTGREAGLGLIYCTQRPDSDVINPLVKANMDCKICFKTETESNSIIVLDRPGAEKLPHGKPGRVLYSRDGLEELQVPYIGGEEAWEKLLEPYWTEEDIQDETGGGEDPNLNEGCPSNIDGTSGALLLEEWEPVKASERNAQEFGGAQVDRGQAEGNRQEQTLETILRWSFPSEGGGKKAPPL